MRAYVYFVIALCCGLAAGESKSQTCRSPSSSGSSQGGLSVPIAIHGGGVFVPVRINDLGTYDFLLDSGFEDSVIDPATARALHLSSTAEHDESAPGGMVKSAQVNDAKLTVAGLPLANAP